MFLKSQIIVIEILSRLKKWKVILALGITFILYVLFIFKLKSQAA